MLTGLDNGFQMVSLGRSWCRVGGGGLGGNTRSGGGGGRGKREPRDMSSPQEFSGSDLWLPQCSCDLPQIETRLTVLKQSDGIIYLTTRHTASRGYLTGILYSPWCRDL